LRHYTTNWKVAGLISDVIGFFNGPNPSSCTMALGSTQPLTGMSIRNLPGVKSGWNLKVTSLPFATCLSRKCGSLDVSQPYRLPWPVIRINLLLLIYYNGFVFYLLMNPVVIFLKLQILN
jgi:hypothetical protein